MISERRNERFPSCGGTVPVRPMSEILSAITLWRRESQVTPIQLQTEVTVDQLVDNMFLGSEIWDFRERSAD